MTAPVLLPWLSGISRETGTPVNDPSSFTDIRNVVAFPGAFRLREGLGDAVNSLDGPVVCGCEVFKAYGLVCWVLYDPATRDVTVVSTNLQGGSETAVGAWGTLSTSAEEPPRFIMAEAYGILVFAHDEPNVAARLETYRFDPADSGNEWDGIEADLDGMGDNPILFRGVVQHLGAIWGWGFGSDSDPDRPEVIRRSNPDDPTVYLAQSFFQVGVRLDPIVAASPVQGSLGIFKGSSWYRLDGATSAEYTLIPVDPVIGCVGARAIQNVNGVVYWWSPFGPKMTTGAGTSDLASPLDLTGPLPADFPVPGSGAYGWTYQDPETFTLSFLFPGPDNTEDRTVAYKLSLRDPANPQWSFDLWERCLLCGTLASTGASSFLIDPGYADPVTVSGAVGAGPATADVAWTNVDCVGDETVEVWAQQGAAAWFLAKSVPVNVHATPQTTTLTSGLTNGAINVAIRHRRLNRYLATYTDPDPTTWPAVSRATGTITAVAAPVITSNVYTPGTQSLDIDWTMATATADLTMEVQAYEADLGSVPGVAVGPLRTVAFAPSVLTSVGTTLGPTGSFDYPANEWEAAATLTSDLLTVARTRGYYLKVRIRGNIGATVGNWSNLSTVFIGYPSAPSWDGLPAPFDWVQVTRFSVALGTRNTWSWQNSSNAAGKDSVRTLGTLLVSSDPPNGGSCTPGLTGDRLLSMDTLLSSPQDVTAPACMTCQIIGQVVGLGNALLRQVLTLTAVAHWTPVSDYPILQARTSAAECGV